VNSGSCAIPTKELPIVIDRIKNTLGFIGILFIVTVGLFEYLKSTVGALPHETLILLNVTDVRN